MEAILIVEGTGVLLVCNLLQSQDVNTQINANPNRVISDSSPSLGLPDRRLETMTREAIPLMPRSSGSGWASREMGAVFTMGGASYCQGHSTLTLPAYYSAPSQGQLVRLAVLTR